MAKTCSMIKNKILNIIPEAQESNILKKQLDYHQLINNEWLANLHRYKYD